MEFDNLHQILRSLYEQMMPLCADMAGVAKGIAGLGALFYVAYRVWQSLARAEPIDVFPMLRPFAVGLCIMFFPTVVLGTINSVLSPVVQGTAKLLETQTLDMNKYREQKDRLEYEAMVRNPETAYLVSNEEFDKQLEELGWSPSDMVTMAGMYIDRGMYKMKKGIRDFFREILELMFQAAALVIDTIRTFFLVVLAILGPIAFAISVWDGFQSTLTQWICRYIQVYLWLPVSDIFSTILAKIQVLMLQSDIERMQTDPNFSLDSSDGVYIVFMIIGIIGYFTASIKKVSDTRVGDTVTESDRPTPEALPGYRPARPMVFCGIYTEDGSKYPDLRDALEKLQLNDAALSFEPESSVALGFGFRCGFLGMLHMEIIQERLEREFDLDLVTTLPSVTYEIVKTDGTVVQCHNPHDYPDPAVIEEAREPYVKASIMTPQEFVGNIMPMCQDRRGIFKDMQYLDANLVELHYEMPTGEIIYDFFDALKARTKGYASLDYEFLDYRKSDLVKVDMLLNGDQVDALSFIVHRDKSYGRARRICEKLKENIPRQLFEVPIQAAIGGKVIARETVKAMRKDVLAKCYGGDISRKKKLLEKQKEGKKKMRALGTVQMPTEAFMAVLKLDEES